MRKSILPIVILAATSLSLAPSATLRAQSMPGGMEGGMGDMGGGGPGGGGGAGAGRPAAPRPPKPVKRRQFDKLVAGMFREVDADGNGIVTIAELHSVVEARRDTAIRVRFAGIDTDRDGSISQGEFMDWQKRMGSAASDDGEALGDRNRPISDAIRPTGDEDDRIVIALIEPLNGTTIARANTNYDAGVTLEELLAYEGKRFEEADKDQDGELSMHELRPADRGDKGRGGRGDAPGGGGAPHGGEGSPPR